MIATNASPQISPPTTPSACRRPVSPEIIEISSDSDDDDGRGSPIKVVNKQGGQKGKGKERDRAEAEQLVRKRKRTGVCFIMSAIYYLLTAKYIRLSSGCTQHSPATS